MPTITIECPWANASIVAKSFGSQPYRDSGDLAAITPQNPTRAVDLRSCVSPRVNIKGLHKFQLQYSRNFVHLLNIYSSIAFTKLAKTSQRLAILLPWSCFIVAAGRNSIRTHS